jgi:Secretion system C-terminal sorting domain/SprB repeat
MKKIYFLLIGLILVSGLKAQCVIDSTILDTVTNSGIYPSAAHLPHIVQDSLYDQTVQGKILASQSVTFSGFNVTLTIDSVRMDSISGLPTGITWVRNPTVLKGGGLGCVEFTGSTTDTAGTYPITGWGWVWGSISIPLLGNQTLDTFISLNRIPPFNNYYVVVDSFEQLLSVTATARNLCFGSTGGSATATASGGSPTSPYLYLWNTGATSYTINNVPAGTYTVSVFSGADTTETSVVISEDPSALTLVTTGDSSLTGNNGSATVSVTGGTPPYTYRWTPGGATTDSIDSLAPGTYMVTVRDSFGCTYRDSAIVYGVTGINPVAEEMPQINLYPNPANSLININIQSPKAINGRIEVLDMTGQVVYTTQANIGGHYNLGLNTANFSAGIYVLQLSSETTAVHERFVITH